MKNSLNKKNVNKFIFDLIMVIFAGALAGMVFKNFFEGHNILPAGLTGLSLIIHNLFLKIPVNIPTSVIYLIINAIIFIIALKILGWKFILFSVIGTVSHIITMQFGAIPGLVDGNSETLLYALLGAMLYGVCVGIAFRFGGSTGGSDIVGALMNYRFPKIKTGYCLMFINCVVISITVFANGIDVALYALMVTVISSMTTNMILDGSKRIVAFYIVCDKDKEVSQALSERFRRGVTKIEATGVFSQQNKSLLLCLVPNRDSRIVKKLVQDIDKDAFIFSSSVTETLGESNFLNEMTLTKNKIKKAKKYIKKQQAFKRYKAKKYKKRICSKNTLFLNKKIKTDTSNNTKKCNCECKETNAETNKKNK